MRPLLQRTTTSALADAKRELAELRAREQRVSKVVAATLQEVHDERERLLAELSDARRANKELCAALDAQADELALAKAALKQQHERFGAIASHVG